MPNYGVVGNRKTAWQFSSKPRVFIGEEETEVDFLTCTSIEHHTGLTPSRALLRIGTTAFTGDGPITLNRFQFPWTRGTKVVVKVGNTVRFRGCMIKRRDRGQNDDIVWEAWCDKWLLMQIPVRGCIVRDPSSGEAKFISGFEPRTNPAGRWNCIGCNINGSTYPVFTHVAEVGKIYESPTETFGDNLVNGKLTAWTPRRWLQYLRLLTRLGDGDMQGMDPLKWRSLRDCTRLEWLDSANNLIGKDTEQEFDPLDRKLPDISFRGMRMLGAINRVLEAAGTHGLMLDYAPEKSYVAFYPRGFSGALDLNYSSVDLRILRGGNADDINTIYDFELDEDASEVAEAVLVEGARVHVETQFEYSPDFATVRPAWTEQQLLAYLQCIEGDGTYAGFPSKEGSTDVDQIADGSINGVFAMARSHEAVALARQYFPEVGRAFIIDTEECVAAGLTEGKTNEFEDQDTYPVLGIKGRRALLEQLQYYTGQDGQRLMQKYPVRIQIKREGEWKDVPANNGWRVDDRGWIWVDGLWEDADGGPFCFYSGKLIGLGADPLGIEERDIRINMAMALDHRVDGFAGVPKPDSTFDEDLFLQLGGPPLLYIDSPEAYHEEIQRNSSPNPAGEVVSTDDGTGAPVYVPTPVTRYLPPGSERSHAEYAAERRLFGEKWVKRRSRWSYVGIRPDFKLGQWIGVVKVINPKDNDSDYEINAPIEMLTDDFLEQTTVVGGLLSTSTRKADMARGGEDADGRQHGDMTESQKVEYAKIESGEIESKNGFVGAGNIFNNPSVKDWASK